MKKIFLLFLLTVCISSMSFSKELAGNDLLAVNMTLEAKLQTANISSLRNQISCLDEAETKIRTLEPLSQEASIICRNTIALHKETLKSQDRQKSKKNKDPASRKTAEKCLEEYRAFAQSHTDLSSHFQFHYLEAEVQVLSYGSKAKMLAKPGEIIEKYRKLDQAYPNYGENLIAYGTILYALPKINGGNKELALSKLSHATKTGATTYEKVTAYTVYSQLLFDQNRKKESEEALSKARELAPNNPYLILLQSYNKAGKCGINTNALF